MTIVNSQSYTNHSIRVTGATALTRQQYGNKQIMSVTGHKSVSFLAIYQRTSNSENLAMGQALNTVLGISSNSVVPVSNAPTYMPHTYVASSNPDLAA